ncbi:MAG TPA: hypothetical protein VF761_16815 [Gemmatimonadaceae bacterium]
MNSEESRRAANAAIAAGSDEEVDAVVGGVVRGVREFVALIRCGRRDCTYAGEHMMPLRDRIHASEWIGMAVLLHPTTPNLRVELRRLT